MNAVAEYRRQLADYIMVLQRIKNELSEHATEVEVALIIDQANKLVGEIEKLVANNGQGSIQKQSALPRVVEERPWLFTPRFRHETAGAVSLVGGILLACVMGALGLPLPWVFAGLFGGFLATSFFSAMAYASHP